MGKRCREFERFETARRDPGRWADWNDHVRTCLSCQQQEAADRELRSLFAGTRPPALPPLFARQSIVHVRELGVQLGRRGRSAPSRGGRKPKC